MRAGLLVHLGLALVTVAVVVPTLDCGLVPWDVGEVVFYADQVARGATPGLDYAVNAYGPGRYLLAAGLFALVGGPSLPALWALWTLLRVLAVAATWELGVRLLPARARIAALVPVTLAWVAPGPLHKGFFVVSSLGIALALLAYARRPDARRATVLGGAIALAALFRLDVGAFGVIGALVVAAADPRRLRHLPRLVGPLGAGLGAAGALLASRGALRPVLGQLADDIGKNQRIPWPTFPGPGELLDAGLLSDAALLWSPLFVWPALWLLLARRGPSAPREERVGLGVLLLMGVLACNQVRMKPEYGHFLQAAPLLFIAVTRLALVGLERGRGPGLLPRLALCSCLPALLALHTVREHRGDVYGGSFTVCAERTHRVRTPLGTVRLGLGEARRLQPLLERLAQEPPGALWVPTNQPLLYALAERPDVTGYVGLIYYAENPRAEEELIARLEDRAPPLAVFVDDSIEGPSRRLAQASPRVHAYLLRRYEKIERIGNADLMRRRDPSRPPGRFGSPGRED